jgi:uncharacterized surface protein with fasciclin (FAS1) repeats
MRFPHVLSRAAITTGAVSFALLCGSSTQAETLRLANHHTDGSMMDSTEQSDSTMTGSGMTIVEVASNNDSFSTLVQAVQAADLASTLSGEGPYTVFAPTDEAFNQLPDGALEFLLQPENQDILAEVLTYHVVPGAVMSGDLSSGAVNTLNGGVAVDVSESGVVVNNASVVTADIAASNGVIHVINRVLIPENLQQELASHLGVDDIY